MKCCRIRKVLIGVPAVMLLCVAGLFFCELASVGYSAVSKPFAKNTGSVYNYRGKQRIMDGEQVAYFVAYSFAASLLAASSTYALKSCSKGGSSCKVTPPPVE